jgi:hypothetical protein
VLSILGVRALAGLALDAHLLSSVYDSYQNDEPKNSAHQE